MTSQNLLSILHSKIVMTFMNEPCFRSGAQTSGPWDAFVRPANTSKNAKSIKFDKIQLIFRAFPVYCGPQKLFPCKLRPAEHCFARIWPSNQFEFETPNNKNSNWLLIYHGITKVTQLFCNNQSNNDVTKPLMDSALKDRDVIYERSLVQVKCPASCSQLLTIHFRHSTSVQGSISGKVADFNLHHPPMETSYILV